MGRSLQGKSITLLVAERERGQSSPTSTPSKSLYIQPITKDSSLFPCGIIKTQLDFSPWVSGSFHVRVILDKWSPLWPPHFSYSTWNSRTTFCHLSLCPDTCCFQFPMHCFIIFNLLITGRYQFSLHISTIKVLLIPSSFTKFVLIILFV